MSAYVITVAQQKGGAGKSTLATHLAVAFAKMGYSTMLFDTDPQGTTTHWHAQRKLGDLGLMATSGWRLTRDLAMAKEGNDIIIIDTPPHAEMDIKVSTRAADIVLVPIQPSPADLWAVKETFNTIAGESRSALAVLNRVVHRANITTEIREKLNALDVPVAKTEIGSRVMFAASMETGLTVLDGFSNPSEGEIMSLVRELAEKIGISLKPSAGKGVSKEAHSHNGHTHGHDEDAPAKNATEAHNPSKKDKNMPTTVKKKAATKKATVKKAPAKKAPAKKAAPKKAAKPAVKKAAPKKAAKPAVKKATPKKAAKPAVKKAAPKKAATKKPAVKKAPAKKAAPKKAKAQLDVVTSYKKAA